MRYDQIFAVLAERAVQQGSIDAQTFVQAQALAGASEERIMELLLHDLQNDGPVFGKFLRGLKDAAASSVSAAVRQGEVVGFAEASGHLERLTRIAGIEGSVIDALDNADPEAADAVEDAIGEQEFQWVATLINTCDRCLPLHGKVRTMAEWREMGLLPETIHSGWNSSCQCRLVPYSLAADRDDLAAPLKRVRVGGKSAGRTVRALGGQDLDKALSERDRLLKTDAGRRMLRLLGESATIDPEEQG